MPVSLATTGALALVNMGLAARISAIRHPQKVDVGHGGIELLERRMRAHANFAEYVPVALILVALIEFAGGPSWPLAALAGMLVIARALHPFGMEGWSAGRVLGTLGTWIPTVLLALWAIGLAVAPLLLRSP